MLNFFDRVGKLERIVNVSGLLVSNTKNPQGAKAKHTYQYAPNESVVGDIYRPQLSSVTTWVYPRERRGQSPQPRA